MRFLWPMAIFILDGNGLIMAFGQQNGYGLGQQNGCEKRDFKTRKRGLLGLVPRLRFGLRFPSCLS